MDKFFRKLMSPESLLEEFLKRIFGDRHVPRSPEEYCGRLEICLRKKGGFSEKEIKEQALLVSDHLHDSMQERLAQGLSEAEAWEQTLNAYGNVGEAAGGCNPIGEFSVTGLPLTLVVGVSVLFLVRGATGVDLDDVLSFLIGLGGGIGALLQLRAVRSSSDKLFVEDSCLSVFFWKSVLFSVNDFIGWRFLWVLVIRLLLGSVLVAAVAVFTIYWDVWFANFGYIGHPFIGAFVGTLVVLHGLGSPVITKPMFSMMVRVQLILERRLVD